jgi:hypothetical protein
MKKEVITIVSLLIALFVLLFGNNIYQQFTGHSVFATATAIPDEPFESLPSPTSPQVIRITEVSRVTEIIPASATSPIQPTFDSTFIANANKSCNEFGGQPVSATALTDEQIQRWRSIGQTNSNNEVGKVIYCEVHQIPGFKGFVEGDTIPTNAIITADLGYNWNTQYVGALERLVYYDGGWGVFLSIKSFTVQHANDLPNRIGGQYWIIK